MFTKVKLRNFRSFDKIEFDLTDKNHTPKHLAVVYGENGAGKSNLMSAFYLLNELMQTLDVREAYERMLRQEAIFQDENVERAMRQEWLSNLRDMRAIINDYRMVGSDGPIIAEYEFCINGSVGEYYIELGEEEILRERLVFLINTRRGVYFDCNPENLSINNAIVSDKDLLSDIKGGAKRFWGKHTMLSIVKHELQDKSTAYGWKNLSKYFYDVFAEFRLMSCSLSIGGRRKDFLQAPLRILKDPSKGTIVKSEEHQLDFAEQIFTQFFSAINSEIQRVFYQRTYQENSIAYQLKFEKMIAGTNRILPFEIESTGNHQLLNLLAYVLCACMGGTVVIDEADSGIHDIVFQKMITELDGLIYGQLIVSTHNTMLMETDFARDSVYVIYEEDQGLRRVRCVNDYEKRTYLNSNVRNKYLNNAYGGLPMVQPFKFKELLAEVEKELRQ